jgi:hypothetical protein
MSIILDKIYNKSVPKPTSLRPGYDIAHIMAQRGYSNSDQFEKTINVEKIYDNLSIIRSYGTPQQWVNRVKTTLQTLIDEGYKSFYHVFCLFGSFGEGVTNTYYDNFKGREVVSSYHRPSIHKSQMAICFNCWKLVKITTVKPRKVYYDGWRRWVYEIKPEDLMKNHWDQECDDPLTDAGRVRVRQQAFDNFKKINKLSSIQIQDVYFKENDLKYWYSAKDKSQLLILPLPDDSSKTSWG